MFSWTSHQKGSPKEADCGAVAVRHELYYFGRNTDENNKDQIDVHVFNTVSLLWIKLTPATPGTGEGQLEVPPRGCGHTAVLIEDTVYIWGGAYKRNWGSYNYLYAFDVNAHRWFKPKVSGTVPERRHCHSACVLEKAMYIHGGYNNISRVINDDLYVLDTSTMVWSLINTRGAPPPVSQSHSATIIGTKMFVFGGYMGATGQDNHIYYNTIRVFDTETNCWMKIPSTQLLPQGRCSHSAFTHTGELYIFAGYNYNQQYFNDVWKFSPETFSWKNVKPNGKGPSPTCRMCCCMMGDRVVLFGGINTADDLYILDLSPSLKSLCKLALTQYGLEQSQLPHNIRWELAAMSNKR